MRPLVRAQLARQWFRLFRYIDKDDAGRIYYKNFKAFVRNELQARGLGSTSLYLPRTSPPSSRR